MKPSPSAAAFHGSFPLGSSLRHRSSRRVSLGGRKGRQDVSLGTNWHGEMAYEEFIDQDIFNTKNLTTNWGDDSPRPLVDKVLAVEPCRERYAQYLENYILPANELFLLSEYEARFDQLLAPYGDKTTNDFSEACQRIPGPACPQVRLQHDAMRTMGDEVLDRSGQIRGRVRAEHRE